MTKNALWTIVMLSMAQVAFAEHGFQPGLWRMTQIYSGLMQGTGRSSVCLRDLQQEAHTGATFGPAMPVPGAMRIRITHTLHSTTVTWGDRMRQGSAVTRDRGWYRFTRRGPLYVMRGAWVRSQTRNGQKSVIHETLRGRRVSRVCPAALPAPVFVSPALQSLNAENAKLQAATQQAMAALAKLKKAGEVP